MIFTNLHTRRRDPEWMDQPDLDHALHASALKGLHRLNRVSRSSEILWRPIHLLCKQARTKPLRVLDIASGGGDVVLALARRASQRGLAVTFQGCDISSFAVRFANEQAKAQKASNVCFTQLDAIGASLPQSFDVIMCSLFLHHLSHSDALMLLGKMAQATRKMVLINDLRRTRLGYALAWGACRALSRSAIVHGDGPISVAAAYTVDEARALAQEAGLAEATLTRHFPQRFLLTWRRSP